MKDSIIIRSMIDAKTFWDFSRFNTYRLSVRGWMPLALFPLFMVVLGVLNLSTGGVALGVGFVLIGVAYPISFLLYYRRSIQQQIDKYHLETPQNSYTCTVGPEGFQVEKDGQTLTQPWEKVWRVFRLEDYLYVYILKNRSFILPVRCIEDASLEELLALLGRYLPQGALVDRRRHRG